MATVVICEFSTHATTRTEKEIASLQRAGWTVELALVGAEPRSDSIPVGNVGRPEPNPLYEQAKAEAVSAYEAKERLRRSLRLDQRVSSRMIRRLLPEKTIERRVAFKRAAALYGMRVRLQQVAQTYSNPVALGRQFGDLTRMDRVWRDLALEMAQSTADVFQAQDLNALPPVIWAAKLREPSPPVVFDCHEWFTELNYLPEVYREAWNEVASTFVPEAQISVGVSPQMADWLAAYGARRSEVLWNYPVVDNAVGHTGLRARLGLPESRPLAVHVGYVALDRGLDKSISLLSGAPDLHLCLLGFGDPAKTAELERAARTEGVDSRLHLIPWIEPEQLVHSIADADLNLILHDDRFPDRRKTMPNKLFDGLAAGLPAVAHANTYVGEFVDENGLGLTYRDDDDLAPTVEKALSDSALATRVSARSEEFRWDAQADRYVGWLADLVSSSAEEED